MRNIDILNHISLLFQEMSKTCNEILWKSIYIYIYIHIIYNEYLQLQIYKCVVEG